VANETVRQPKVIFCSCAYFDVIPRRSKERILGALRSAGVAVEAVVDLCGVAASRDPQLQRWAQADSLVVVACYPRAVRWLFEAAGTRLPERNVRLFNMRTQSAEEILAGLLAADVPDEPMEVVLPDREEGWVPWFPVIDYNRCRNCKQCMNFCLFGVYGLTPEGQVRVQNPAGCKTNCPACARVCPAQAIIFPKYADAPINGDEVAESNATEEMPVADLRAALQGNVYDRIRQRQPGQKRFSTEPQDSSNTDADRPCPTIESLRRDLAIPPDVLASLSPAELQRIRQVSRQEKSDGSPNQSCD